MAAVRLPCGWLPYTPQAHSLPCFMCVCGWAGWHTRIPVGVDVQLSEDEGQLLFTGHGLRRGYQPGEALHDIPCKWHSPSHVKARASCSSRGMMACAGRRHARFGWGGGACAHAFIHRCNVLSLTLTRVCTSTREAISSSKRKDSRFPAYPPDAHTYTRLEALLLSQQCLYARLHAMEKGISIKRHVRLQQLLGTLCTLKLLCLPSSPISSSSSAPPPEPAEPGSGAAAAISQSASQRSGEKGRQPRGMCTPSSHGTPAASCACCVYAGGG